MVFVFHILVTYKESARIHIWLCKKSMVKGNFPLIIDRVKKIRAGRFIANVMRSKQLF